MLSPIPKWLGSEAASEPLVQKLFFHAAEENYTLPLHLSTCHCTVLKPNFLSHDDKKAKN